MAQNTGRRSPVEATLRPEFPQGLLTAQQHQPAAIASGHFIGVQRLSNRR
jgi:hypothetical protein